MSGDQDIRLVPVRTFSGGAGGGSLDAGLAKDVLEAQGVECSLSGELHGELYMEVLPAAGIQLLVREDDAARAAEILAAYFDVPAGEGLDGPGK